MEFKLYPGSDFKQQESDIGKARALAIHILQECEKQGLSQFAVEQIPDEIKSLLECQEIKRSCTSKFMLD